MAATEGQGDGGLQNAPMSRPVPLDDQRVGEDRRATFGDDRRCAHGTIALHPAGGALAEPSLLEHLDLHDAAIDRREAARSIQLRRS